MNQTDALNSLAAGGHSCLLYSDTTLERELIASFLLRGLQQNERCFLVVDEAGREEWTIALEACGIDVQSEIETGRLVVGRSRSRPLADDFTSLRMARTVWASVQESLVDYRGIRFAIDMAASLALEVPADRLCHWEATLDLLHADAPLSTICMYDLNRSSPAEIHGALRTHPLALLNQRAVANPYYEARAILEYEPELNASDADAETVSHMIERLREQ
jgi:hypothetical protein